MRKTRMKNVIKEVQEAISSNSPEVIVERLREAISTIDKTASKGVIHKNNAARKISRLTRKINAILAEQKA